MNKNKTKSFSSTVLGKKIEATMQGGVYLRIDIFNNYSTNIELSNITGISESDISLMVSCEKQIDIESANKFSKVFDRPVCRYLHWIPKA